MNGLAWTVVCLVPALIIIVTMVVLAGTALTTGTILFWAGAFLLATLTATGLFLWLRPHGPSSHHDD